MYFYLLFWRPWTLWRNTTCLNNLCPRTLQTKLWNNTYITTLNHGIQETQLDDTAPAEEEAALPPPKFEEKKPDVEDLCSTPYCSCSNALYDQMCLEEKHLADPLQAWYWFQKTCSLGFSVFCCTWVRLALLKTLQLVKFPRHRDCFVNVLCCS